MNIEDNDPRTPLGQQAIQLSAVANQAISTQLAKGAKKGYDGWWNESTIALVFKAVKAVSTKNWAGLLTYAAMLLVQYQNGKAEEDETSS